MKSWDLGLRVGGAEPLLVPQALGGEPCTPLNDFWIGALTHERGPWLGHRCLRQIAGRFWEDGGG